MAEGGRRQVCARGGFFVAIVWLLVSLVIIARRLAQQFVTQRGPPPSWHASRHGADAHGVISEPMLANAAPAAAEGPLGTDAASLRSVGLSCLCAGFLASLAARSALGQRNARSDVNLTVMAASRNKQHHVDLRAVGALEPVNEFPHWTQAFMDHIGPMLGFDGTATPDDLYPHMSHRSDRRAEAEKQAEKEAECVRTGPPLAEPTPLAQMIHSDPELGKVAAAPMDHAQPQLGHHAVQSSRSALKPHAPAIAKPASVKPVAAAQNQELRNLLLTARPHATDFSAKAPPAATKPPPQAAAPTAAPAKAAGATIAETIVTQAHGLSAVPPWFRGNDLCQLTYAEREGYGAPVWAAPYAPGGDRSDRIVLSVFDVGQVLSEEDAQKVKEMCTREVDGMWHISLQAFGHSYDNPRMVDGILPSTLKPFLRYQYVLPAAKGAKEFRSFFAELRSQECYSLDKYDMQHNNCNHFQHECVKFLVGPGKPIPLFEAPEVMSPLDFDRERPDPEIHRFANTKIMRGMLKRRRELKKESADRWVGTAQLAIASLAGIGWLLSWVASGQGVLAS